MSTIEKALEKLSGQGRDPSKKSIYADTAQTKASYASTEIDPETVFIDKNMLLNAGMLAPGMGRSAIAEEYRHIKRPLLENVLDSSATANTASNLIMVTSSYPGEGKTFTAINLAISIAMEMDHTCLLVDADVARPSVMRALGIRKTDVKGLVEYLKDDKIPLSDLLLKTDIPKLSILPAGRPDVHGTELLASENMRRLVRELSERYHDRIVIFDTPPLLVTSESRVLASLVGQIVMVVEADKTLQSIAKQALELLDQNKYIALVLNKDRHSSGKDYYYYGSGSKEG